jgi:predicted dehydrogenase
MDQEPDGSATWRNGFGKLPQPSMSSGGGIHAIDTIRWIMGNVEFTEVMGYGNRIAKPWRDVDDLEVAMFRTHSGAVVRVVVSKGLKRPSSQAYAVYGTAGSAEKPRNDGTTAAFGGGEAPIYFSGDPGPVHHHPPMQRIDVGPPQIDPARAKEIGHGGLTYLEFRDFVEAILEDRQPIINVYEGARSSAAGICAWKSIQEGRPFKIPQFPDRSADYKRFRKHPVSERAAALAGGH